jgi:hypothetical protein
MKRLIATAALVLCASVSFDARLTAQASAAFGVTYMSGHAGAKQFNAVLLIDATALIVNRGSVNKEGPKNIIFTIPLSTIVSTLASKDLQDDESVEFVTVTTESADGAEAIVFRTRKNESANIAAKINFAVKKAKETQSGQTPRAESQKSDGA